MKHEKDNLLNPINEKQITKILETLSDVYNKINGMKNQTDD